MPIPSNGRAILSVFRQIRSILLAGASVFCLSGSSLWAQSAGTALPKKFVMSGAVQDCWEGRTITIRDVKVFVFDVAKSRPVAHQLAKMEALLSGGDSAHYNEHLTRFFLEYDRLLPLVERTRPLARTLTDSVGTYRVTFAPADTILVFAYAELEDQPTFYQYEIMRARPDTSLAIDMSKGECARAMAPRSPGKSN
jgi:hypothetical protein